MERGVLAAGRPILVFSLYLLFAGHNQPGGGFSGGLVGSALVVLAWVAGGTRLVSALIPVRATTLLGVGLALAALTGFASVALGGGFLESGALELDIPLVGTVKAVSPLVFDMGVYLVVIGMTLGMVRSLGEEPER
jgi:multicomponent Na+:H+ antiporter subunit A